MSSRSANDWYSRVIAKELAIRTKGIPVPGTGRVSCGGYCCHSSSSGNSGVMGNSRIVSHRYMDEGEKGRAHRREIRRKERVFWMAEAMEELGW
ncbi:hypothetical protein SEA_EVY_239 [Streptomyces phage Evy]|uniref:Uncharacterized protein n=1 Tax=Streptomyces phage Evy TaxID=2588514 RepID=A0A514DJR8_9CAUD|nr:hypothetical protein KNU67_gp001 [Streptomyces phage Evy]YP_010103582.1 hypothetical protein KNU67_gp059 [Streptomyces phage Evy]UEM46790.1 hypothetical protein SEA_TARGARYEN_1 [Streptomyces phage Targaryen]QDH93870.1 hypothetical protein SEA_EVY_1 [Streptomyces phage Evy]QDH94073.1 hypothetical protein SEA_EVY_239 [Streptomyces phage Evy]UEM46997.1 hypothetical protein SEA_TARGARYEN_252 [Streptomyces phage Targaryen]